MKKLAIPILILSILFAFVACENGTPTPEQTVGTIQVSIVNQVNTSGSRGIEPEGLEVSKYSLTITGQDTTIGPVELTLNTMTYTAPVLPGTWTIKIDALNSNGIVVGSGSAATTVIAGQTVACQVTVVETEGNGQLNINFTDSSKTLSGLKATATNAAGTSYEVELNSYDGVHSGSISLPKGFYAVSIASSDSTFAMDDSVRIYAGLTTQFNGSFDGSSLTVGTVDEIIRTPEVKINCASSVASNGMLKANATVSGLASYSTFWTLNGEKISESSTLSYDISSKGFTVGQNVRLTVFVTSGSIIWSDSTTLTIADAVFDPSDPTMESLGTDKPYFESWMQGYYVGLLEEPFYSEGWTYMTFTANDFDLVQYDSHSTNFTTMYGNKDAKITRQGGNGTDKWTCTIEATSFGITYTITKTETGICISYVFDYGYDTVTQPIYLTKVDSITDNGKSALVIPAWAEGTFEGEMNWGGLQTVTATINPTEGSILMERADGQKYTFSEYYGDIIIVQQRSYGDTFDVSFTSPKFTDRSGVTFYSVTKTEAGIDVTVLTDAKNGYSTRTVVNMTKKAIDDGWTDLGTNGINTPLWAQEAGTLKGNVNNEAIVYFVFENNNIRKTDDNPISLEVVTQYFGNMLSYGYWVSSQRYNETVYELVVTNGSSTYDISLTNDNGSYIFTQILDGKSDTILLSPTSESIPSDFQWVEEVNAPFGIPAFAEGSYSTTDYSTEGEAGTIYLEISASNIILTSELGEQVSKMDFATLASEASSFTQYCTANGYYGYRLVLNYSGGSYAEWIFKLQGDDILMVNSSYSSDGTCDYSVSFVFTSFTGTVPSVDIATSLPDMNWIKSTSSQIPSALYGKFISGEKVTIGPGMTADVYWEITAADIVTTVDMGVTVSSMAWSDANSGYSVTYYTLSDSTGYRMEYVDSDNNTQNQYFAIVDGNLEYMQTENGSVAMSMTCAPYNGDIPVSSSGGVEAPTTTVDGIILPTETFPSDGSVTAVTGVAENNAYSMVNRLFRDDLMESLVMKDLDVKDYNYNDLCLISLNGQTMTTTIKVINDIEAKGLEYYYNDSDSGQSGYNSFDAIIKTGSTMTAQDTAGVCNIVFVYDGTEYVFTMTEKSRQVTSNNVVVSDTIFVTYGETLMSYLGSFSIFALCDESFAQKITSNPISVTGAIAKFDTFDYSTILLSGIPTWSLSIAYSSYQAAASYDNNGNPVYSTFNSEGFICVCDGYNRYMLLRGPMTIDGTEYYFDITFTEGENGSPSFSGGIKVGGVWKQYPNSY